MTLYDTEEHKICEGMYAHCEHGKLNFEFFVGKDDELTGWLTCNPEKVRANLGMDCPTLQHF